MKLRVRAVRGDVVETTHEVAVAVVDQSGGLRESFGNPELVTPTRSAAKPFQALPLVEDGVVGACAVTPEELALACASHNSERHQVATVRAWLERLGLREEQLVCGPHRALAKDLGFPRNDGTWEDVELASPSPAASNCSGKHTGMLALARFHGWDEATYALEGHPVQERCRTVLSDWCDVPLGDLRGVVDGCGVVSWAVPLRALATGFARLAKADGAMKSIVSAMTERPDLVAGERRLCTSLMRAHPGRVLAKVGAAGVYGATLLDQRIGVAIKVLDGDPRAAAAALLAVLDTLGLDCQSSDVLSRFVRPVILNTNREVVGHYQRPKESTHTT